MACSDSRSERLSALADGELKGIVAWRLRRHIVRCPACATDLADLRRTDSLLRLADVVPLAERSAPVVPATRTHRRRVLLVRSLAAAGALACAVGGTLLWHPGPGQISRTGDIAYADVENAMQKIRTARWYQTSTVYDPATGKELYSVAHTRLIRTDPPAAAWHFEGMQITPGFQGAIRIPQDDILQEETRQQTYDRAQNRVTVYENTPGKSAMGADGKRTEVPLSQSAFRNLLQSSIVFRAPSTSASRHYRLPEWHKTTAFLNGRQVQLFTGRFGPRDGGSNGSITDVKVWVDPDTCRYLRVEDQTVMVATGKVTRSTVCEGYQYDISLPDATFALSVSPGALYQYSGPYFPTGAPVTLTSAQKKALEQITRTVNVAIQERNPNHLASVWDWDRLNQWAGTDAAMKARRGLWDRAQQGRGEWQYTGMEPIRAQKQQGFASVEFGPITLPANTPPLIKATVFVKWRRNTSKNPFDIGFQEEFYLSPDGSHILGWNLPDMAPRPRVRFSDHR